MSEEIKDIFECLKKYANLTPDAIDDLYSLEGTIEDLQQKVEQLEKENEKLKYLVDDSHTMKAFIVEHNKVEQLENIRKEIKEYIEKNVACFKNGDMLVELNVDDLLNILNKGE